MIKCRHVMDAPTNIHVNVSSSLLHMHFCSCSALSFQDPKKNNDYWMCVSFCVLWNLKVVYRLKNDCGLVCL